ncbi:MAG: hypothetical protein IT327_06675 [Anaerolineae bacterium]|nr:hypothetical protein [Anaerolineae bacterium]
MLDPGSYLAEAIYFLQYTLAQILWAINRATISIAVIAESINSWVTDNVGYFVQLLVNALSAPLGGMFILALTALGFWYVLNNVVPTSRWVDPSKLFSYGLIAFFFFSSPIVVIDMMEELRQSLNVGIDAALIDGAAGDIFDTSMDGTDVGLPGAIPDVNSDGVVGSFDLVSAFMLVANIDELDSSEFPVDFEATYFPFGDPSSITLSDEADQELAKALASDGIERLFFALIAVPTAIAEHFLRLALTGVAVFLYTGVPFAMLFAFFIYTQAFLGSYLRQFINLLIETLMSVIIVAIMIGLLVAAAQQGIGLYIGASLIVLIVLLWRIKSALKLAAAAFDLFGGGMMTGGSGGMELARMGRQAVTGTAALAGAALTGGTAVAAGGAFLTAAAALRADGNQNGAYLGTDPEKTDGRVRQLKTIAGYALGKSETVRSMIEGTHEARTLARNFRDGEVQPHDPDMLDYLRAGSSLSGFGSSPWVAMRFSQSLREAFDQIGGRRTEYRDAAFDGDGEPVDLPATASANEATTNRGSQDGRSPGNRVHWLPADEVSRERSAGAQTSQPNTTLWREAPATPQQLAYLRFLKVEPPGPLTRGQASDLIEQAKGASGQGAAASGAGRRQGPPVPNTAPQANGPIPDWLQEEPAPEPPPGLVDVFWPGEAELSAGNSPAYAATRPRIRLEPASPERQQLMQATVAQLADRSSPGGQAAYQTLVVYTGQGNADLIEAAVSQHTAASVQAATTATVDLVSHYRAEGLDDAALLTTFQQGRARAALREQHETSLNDDQLSAVADMVLLPQRRLTRDELAYAIGQAGAANEAATEQDVAAVIGSPPGFGGQTGNVRGVLSGAQAMNLSPAELARLAEMIQDGLRDRVQAELANRGYRPEMVRNFVSDMAALPGVLVVPQSTAVQSPTAGPTAVNLQQVEEE